MMGKKKNNTFVRDKLQPAEKFNIKQNGAFDNDF